MIHTRKVRETVRLDTFFKNNNIPEKAEYIHEMHYDVKVKTPYGYYSVPSICRTVSQKSIRLYFTNNKTLQCGWEHKLKVNGEWKLVKDINIENDIIETENGTAKIRKIKEGKIKILYDLMVDKVQCFYGNGILSHNTWILTCIGAYASSIGKQVAHYTMELSESYVGARYDTVITHIATNQLKDKQAEIYSKIKALQGNIMIKYFPPRGVSTKQIELHIEQMIAAGKKPDLIIIDYADLMLSSTGRNDSTYQEQGGVYIELRGLSGMKNIPVWTASQTNRCLTLDTKVDTPLGKVEIGSIKKGDKVLTHNGYKNVTHVFEKKTQPVYKIKLKSGKVVKCSARHLFPTQYGKQKSIETGLKVGDKLFTKKVSKKKATFSENHYIEKYGKEDGLKKMEK